MRFEISLKKTRRSCWFSTAGWWIVQYTIFIPRIWLICICSSLQMSVGESAVHHDSDKPASIKRCFLCRPKCVQQNWMSHRILLVQQRASNDLRNRSFGLRSPWGYCPRIRFLQNVSFKRYAAGGLLTGFEHTPKNVDDSSSCPIATVWNSGVVNAVSKWNSEDEMNSCYSITIVMKM